MSDIEESGDARIWRRGLLGIALLMLFWELSTRMFSLPHYILPPVSAIVIGMKAYAPLLFDSALITVGEAMGGLVLGTILGVILAMIVTVMPRIRNIVLSFANAVNSVPVICLSPLLLLWFGMGMQSKIAMVTITVTLMIFLSALGGLDRVDNRAVDLLRSFGSGRVSIMWRLRLPTAAPLILAGVRVAIVRSMAIAIAAEMLGAEGGLGWVIFQAVLKVDFIQVWGAIFTASLASLAIFGLVSSLERRLVFWN